MRLATTTLLLALAATAATAQDLLPKAPPQRTAVVIRNAVIHPVSAPTIERGFVVFADGRITAVGSGDPPLVEAETIDAEGAHVYPGLIGASTGLGLAEHGAVRATRDEDEVGAVTPEVRAAVAVNPDSTLFPVARLNGLLVAATFPTGGAIPGRVSVLRLDGWTWESMAIDDAAALLVEWPRTRPIRAWWMDQSDEEQMDEATKRRAAVTEAFTAAEAYGKARAADGSMPVDLRWEAMLPFLPSSDGKRGKPIFVEANDLDQIVEAVSFAVDRNLNLVLVGGRDARGCLDRLKKHDVPVIVTGTVGMPKRDDSPFDDPFTLPRDLEAAGVRWCLATGERLGNERNLPYDAARAAAFGLDRAAALRSITLSAAEILGIDERYGSLEKGKSATLIVTTGDPMEITTQVRRAFIDGREIRLESKQTALAEKYRTKYGQLKDSEK